MDDETSNIYLSLSPSLFLIFLARLSSRAAGLEIELFGCWAKLVIEVKEKKKRRKENQNLNK